jgi:TolB protein
MIAAFCIGALALTAQPTSAIAYLALTDGYWQVWTMSEEGANARQVTRSPGDKMRVSWYPDAKRLFMTGSDGHVYRVDAVSGEEKRIPTSLQGFQDAVLSPDGKTFAFSMSMSGSVDDHDIWIADENGDHARKLTTMPWLQHEPAWSADSRWIYFLSGNGDQTHDIWRVAVEDRHTEQITANDLYHFEVAVASDGRLAYSGNQTGHYDIWIRPLNGTDRALTDDAALDAHPSWAPDGNNVVFESSSGGTLGIWWVDLNSGQRKRLTAPEVPSRYPVWKTAGSGL